MPIEAASAAHRQRRFTSRERAGIWSRRPCTSRSMRSPTPSSRSGCTPMMARSRSTCCASMAARPPMDFASEISTQFATIMQSSKPTNGVHVEIDDEITGTSIIPQGSDPLTTEPAEGRVDVDPWLAMSATDPTSVFRVDQGTVRLALVTGEHIVRGLGGAIDVRVLLHREPSYPGGVLVIGPPAAFRVPSPTQLAVLPLDISSDLDRAVLNALAKKFEIHLDIILRAQPIRHVTLTAPLAENVAYILRAADDHLRGIQAEGEQEPSFQRARDLVLGAGFDLLGAEHVEHQEFRDDKLAQLATAQHLRRAIAIARRFARPSPEDYLVCTRGFPLTRWRDLRELGTHPDAP